MSAPIAISVVAPMHDEEACVDEFVRRTDAALQALGRSYEIIVVSDGSTDGTEARLRALALLVPALRGVFLGRNTGQCNALYAGVQESRGDVVVVMDGDLQHPPEEIHLLLAEMERGRFGLVSGTRRGRTENLLTRQLPSRIANHLLRRVSGCEVRDMGGFKVVRGDLIRSMRLRAGQHRLLPALAWMRGASVGEVFVSAPARFAGQSHYGPSRSLDVLFDVVMLWFQGSFKRRPIYLFGRLGGLILLVAGLLGAWLIYDKFVYGEALTSRPHFFVVIMLFLTALFTLVGGFILELLSDALDAAAEVRPYVVRERVGGPRP